MLTTHSAIGFTDATGHILAPVGGLAWLCIGLSCKKTSSCFDRYWPNFAKVISLDCVSHVTSLTCCLSPRLKYLTAYLTFLLGSKSTRHLRFNMSNTKLKIFFSHPPRSSSNFSHLSKWHQLPPSCSGQKTLAVILGSSLSLYPTSNISASPVDVPFTLQPECSHFHLLCCHPYQNHHHFLAWATMIAFLLVSFYY